jgi:hypothetical protein
MAGERLHHELGSRAAEGMVHKVTHHLPLSLLSGHPCLIDVSAGGFIPFDEALGGHNLHELQNGGVAKLAAAFESGVDVANGAGTQVPKNAEDFEFGVCGTRKIGAGHLKSRILRRCSYCQRISSYVERRREFQGIRMPNGGGQRLHLCAADFFDLCNVRLPCVAFALRSDPATGGKKSRKTRLSSR